MADNACTLFWSPPADIPRTDMANIDSVANMANTEPKQQPHGTGDMDVVPNAEQETVKTEREQTVLAPQANNVNHVMQRMEVEPERGVCIDVTGKEAFRRRPRFQIAPNDKG